jgi:cyclopropane-fatty-acyl-phospholipid synthase
MAWKALRDRIGERLERADIVLDGGRPWDPVVHDERLFGRVMAGGSLALGEAYMAGWWDCAALDELAHRVFRSGVDRDFVSWHGRLDALRSRLANLQTPLRSRALNRQHYDLGNDVFEATLDRRLIYTCGYWQGAATLEEAQEAKLDLIVRKLEIKPGMRVLDIGCGWGGTAKFIAERCQAEVVGVTLSEEQAEYAREVCRGLPVSIRVQDYRQIEGRFDRVLTVGMFEHVGHKNHRVYMELVHGLLEPEGMLLLHTIGRNTSALQLDEWMARYIFPNSLLPSPRQVTAAFEGLFVLEDWHNFGVDYDKTLLAWYRNFERNWPSLEARYDERFFRMWRYYLLICAGTFRARYNQLWQLVLSKGGVKGGYRSLR